MTPEAIVAGLGVLFGGGTIAAIVQAVVSHKKGIRDADVARDQTAIAGFKDLAESLRTEVDRLKEARESDSARIDRIEQQIAVERDMKWLGIQHIRALYAWITQHMPGSTPPPPPEGLADHITIPRKDPES